MLFFAKIESKGDQKSIGGTKSTRMGTYIPCYFPVTCENRHCIGGWDCHPDATHPEVEGLFWALRLPECCRWSIHAQFSALLMAEGGRPARKRACRYGRTCYRLSPEHLFQYSHAEREEPTI